MQTTLEDLKRRIERLEEESGRTEELASRLARLEGRGRRDAAVERLLDSTWRDPEWAPTPARPEPTPPRPTRTLPTATFTPPAPAVATAPSPVPMPTPPAPPRPPRGDSLEDLVGGRVLAWAGGLAVVAAVIFLFTMAISRGWIDETMRTVLGGAVSLAFGGLGLWLQERRRSDAALTAMATGAAGLFLTVMVASQVYELVPAGVGVGLALLVGATTTLVALRWESPVIGALGLVGGLLSPALAGAPVDGGTVAVLAATTVAASAVCMWMRWTWLWCASLALPALQWVPYLLDAVRPSVLATVATLLVFGALGVAAAAGYDIRTREQRLPLFSAWLVAANALLVGGVGWWSLSAHSHAAADAWLVGLAIVHLGMGLVCRRSTRCADDLSLVAFALATVTADIALERLTDGAPTVFGWLAGALALGAVTRRATRSHELPVAELGLGAHLAIAITTALTGPASPMNGHVTGSSAAVLLGLAATCLVTGRLVSSDSHPWRQALDGIAIAAVAYLTALSLDGPALVVAWSFEAVALGAIARRTGDPIAAAGAVANLVLAGGHALIFEAPPTAFDTGELDVIEATIGLGVFAGAALVAGRLIGADRREWRLALDAVVIVAMAYLTALLLDGPALAITWAVEAIVLAAIARRTGDPVAAAGAAGQLVLAGSHALLLEAPPTALFTGEFDVVGAALALGAFAGAALVAMRLELGKEHREQIGLAPRPVLIGAAAIAGLHLISLEVVAAFESTGAPIYTGGLELPVHQQAQMALSATWALAGVGALVVGLLRDVRALRLGALTLLGVAAGKVWIFDLAQLDALYRVGSFFVLGLVLLLGAFAWQRIRPRPVPDLRAAPPAAR